MADSVPGDVWAIGTAYEPYVGRWSRLVARELVSWLGVAPGGRWLDLGCGTGALTWTILETADPEMAVGVDSSAGFARYAREQVGRGAGCLCDKNANGPTRKTLSVGVRAPRCQAGGVTEGREPAHQDSAAVEIGINHRAPGDLDRSK